MSPAWPGSRPPPCPACCAAPSSCTPTPVSACSASSRRSASSPTPRRAASPGGGRTSSPWSGLVRGTDELDVERSSLLFIDHIVHAAEHVLRGTDYSLLLTFGSRGEHFEQRVRALAGKADGLLIAEEVLDRGDLRALAAQLPVVVIAGRRDQAVTDVFLSDNASGMTALTGHLTGQHRYHRLCFVAGPKDAPDAAGAVARRSSRPSRPARAAASTRSSTGTSPRTAASRRPGSCSAAPPCRRPWCARTTRWPSACCASCSGRASGSRRTWR